MSLFINYRARARGREWKGRAKFDRNRAIEITSPHEPAGHASFIKIPLPPISSLYRDNESQEKSSISLSRCPPPNPTLLILPTGEPWPIILKHGTSSTDPPRWTITKTITNRRRRAMEEAKS